MTKTIPLPSGKCTIVDDEDYEYLLQWRWCASGRVGKEYVARHIRRQYQDGKIVCRPTIRMHRLIAERVYGLIPNGLQVDHINGDRLDNRRSNLRIVSNAQNTRNQRGRGLSQYTGVGWACEKKKWRAYLMLPGKKYRFLGYFVDEIEAAHVRDIAAYQHFGEHVWLNFPECKEGTRGR